MKLLCLCDSPTLETGFARVARNLLSRWHKADVFEEIWVWGIGYTGNPHSIDFLSNRICPASGGQSTEWYNVSNLERFIRLLDKKEGVGSSPGGFTHLWILQDTFLLFPMAEALQKLCRQRNIRTALYFPVDAPIEAEWANIIQAIDQPVAYCNYGRAQAVRALMVEAENRKATKIRRSAIDRLKVIPHGVDTTVFKRQLTDETRAKNRQRLFHGKVGPKDFVMLNVSQHQKRKGLSQSLEVLAVLKRKFPEMNARLFMHMPQINEGENTNLRQVAIQLGLEAGKDVFFNDSVFKNGHCLLPENYLAAIYEACDLLLSTSYGEGWGLPITEAMAMGLPVAGPRHTSIQEIMDDDRGILFNTLGYEVLPWDMSRLRPRVDIDDAAMKIAGSWLAENGQIDGVNKDSFYSLSSYAARASDWVKTSYLNWDRIAQEWLDLMVPDVQ